VRFRRPSGPTVVTCLLLLLLPTLAVLQYRWVGQVSQAQRERMQRTLWNSAAQFRSAFDGELARAVLSLQVGPATARDGASEQYSNRYTTWLDTADHPGIVAAIYIVDADRESLRLRRWNPETHVFEPAAWPPKLEPLRAEFERDRAEFGTGSRDDRRYPYAIDESLVIAPLRAVVVRGRGSRAQTVTPVFGFTVLELDLDYLRTEMLPDLAARYFSHSDEDGYRVTVTSFDDPQKVLYRSDPDAPTDLSQADVTMPLFFFGRGPGFGDRARGRGPRGGRDGDVARRGDASPVRPWGETGRWRLVAQHQRGSLDAAVAHVQRRNLAISFGILLLLTGSVGLLMRTSRQAHRLAEQQMEFVAGVSHELRTPVAVIRSAAENLSQGVVGSDRVKRYGAILESEARRLGEMVERVLQYAGIESGLALGMKRPVDLHEVIEAAITSAVSAHGAAVRLERHMAADLPPIVGDAAGLRSAIENLIANAVKYGGDDRWVGIRAEVARERRGTEVRITVSDHGPGIPQSELRHIFEPFYRGAQAAARQVHGNGLGLSLVKRIVAAHGGRIAVTTRPGAGSAFTIALPAAPAEASPTPIAAGAAAPVGPTGASA
jgi:signal transduction histidine kinase